MKIDKPTVIGGKYYNLKASSPNIQTAEAARD
jgi:hypothetical protein